MGFKTGIRVNASGQSGTSGYTKNYFLRVNSSGTYSSVSASQIHVSDRRLKTDITEAQDISSVYMRFVPVHFRYKEDVDGVDAHWHYGFIAQDVKQAFIDSALIVIMKHLSDSMLKMTHGFLTRTNFMLCMCR